MSAAAAYAYTEAEQRAYDEGREAFRAGLDYFDSPYMKAERRDLLLLCAFSEGWMDEGDPNRVRADTDSDADCSEQSTEIL